MKRILLSALTIVAVYAALYGMAAFVSMEPNAANWESFWRAIFIWAGCLIGLPLTYSVWESSK